MTDLLYSAKLRLSRGKHHIVDLDKRIRSFLQEIPYTIIRDADVKGVQELEKVTVKFTKPIPDIFAAVAADAVDNLRSALDNAWYAVAIGSGAIGANEEAYFPIGSSITHLNRIIKTGCQRFPHDILTLLRAFHPYKGGNNIIWTLNRICVKNKHRLIAPICNISKLMAHHSTPLGEVNEKRLYFNGRENTTKDEVVFTIFKGNTRIEYDINFAFDVTFDEIPVAYGRPVIEILNDFASIVDCILGSLEAETQRLGYI